MAPMEGRPLLSPTQPRPLQRYPSERRPLLSPIPPRRIQPRHSTATITRPRFNQSRRSVTQTQKPSVRPLCSLRDSALKKVQPSPAIPPKKTSPRRQSSPSLQRDSSLRKESKRHPQRSSFLIVPAKIKLCRPTPLTHRHNIEPSEILLS